MTRIDHTRDLAARGLTPRDIDRGIRAGELERVRRGAYVAPGPEPLDPQSAHRRLIAATLPGLAPGAVLSHASAAVLHGLPTWNAQLARVAVTRDRAGGGRRSRYVEVHGLPLTDAEVTSIDGHRVTTLARTALDLGCTLPLARAVAVGDAALRRGLAASELTGLIESAPRRHGIGSARATAAMLDGRSESPEESRSRVLFAIHGVPTPVPQFEVLDESGLFVARVDFGWPELRTIGEFDGKVKYGRLLRPGQDVGAVVYAEKRREDRLRDLGFEVVRWNSADLDQMTDLLERLQRAFARGRRRT